MAKFALKIPGLKKFNHLATTNIFVLAIRLVQIFFSGCILGIMAYYISQQNSRKEKVPRSFVFSLIVPIFSILTQFNYILDYNYYLFFLWDFAISMGYLISFFWLFDKVEDYLPCKWGAFNPFGTDRCAQTRSVLVMQIIETVLWFTTAVFAAFQVYRTKKTMTEKVMEAFA